MPTNTPVCSVKLVGAAAEKVGVFRPTIAGNDNLRRRITVAPGSCSGAFSVARLMAVGKL